MDFLQKNPRLFNIIKKSNCQTNIEVTGLTPGKKIMVQKSTTMAYTSSPCRFPCYLYHTRSKVQPDYFGPPASEFDPIAPGTAADIQNPLARRLAAQLKRQLKAPMNHRAEKAVYQLLGKPLFLPVNRVETLGLVVEMTADLLAVHESIPRILLMVVKRNSFNKVRRRFLVLCRFQ